MPRLAKSGMVVQRLACSGHERGHSGQAIVRRSLTEAVIKLYLTDGKRGSDCALFSALENIAFCLRAYPSQAILMKRLIFPICMSKQERDVPFMGQSGRA